MKKSKIHLLCAIVSFALIMTISWVVQYFVNPHLQPSKVVIVLEYVFGIILCSIASGWLSWRKKQRYKTVE